MRTTLALLALAGMATAGHAQVIDFEGLGQGTPVDIQYAGLGVVFGATAPDGPASISGYTGYFGSDVLCNATNGGTAGDRRLTLVMVFTTPISEIEFDFHSAGTPSPGFMFPIRFYSGGTLVSADGLMETGSTWARDVSFTGLDNVDRIEIDSFASTWLFGIDNLEFVQGAEPCYADLDGDGLLTIFDFLAFQSLFDAGDPLADCDQDGSLTLFDFLCFQTAFDRGCE
ncbi:MAG: hypothetical protein KatS3mg103_1100 [Phycisphaerales bacterium]|nr:MAG: hypothetical protein KatS3mg103_1100 [Phycisphaerales bacterium]